MRVGQSAEEITLGHFKTGVWLMRHRIVGLNFDKILDQTLNSWWWEVEILVIRQIAEKALQPPAAESLRRGRAVNLRYNISHILSSTVLLCGQQADLHNFYTSQLLFSTPSSIQALLPVSCTAALRLHGNYSALWPSLLLLSIQQLQLILSLNLTAWWSILNHCQKSLFIQKAEVNRRSFLFEIRLFSI